MMAKKLFLEIRGQFFNVNYIEYIYSLDIMDKPVVRIKTITGGYYDFECHDESVKTALINYIRRSLPKFRSNLI